MKEDILALLKENVIQGRKTKDDEGVDGNMVGTPAVLELTQLVLERDIAPEIIIKQSLTAGMQVVGDKFATKEYFIPDMLASAEAVSGAMDILKPYLDESSTMTRGKFAIATVKGDIHDIGKNIVTILLKGAGYEVKDLGIDASPEKIVKVVREYKPDFLGLSALLTTTMVAMGKTIEALKENGLRDKVKVLVGGAAVSEEYAQEIEADAYCVDGFHAIRVLEDFRKVKL
ncbi:MAG: corrinoid protein [Dehalococcoidales bacterium]|nr:corrinoid protein [Dehalococcoidales bacterium]